MTYYLYDRPPREKHWHDRRRTCRHGIPPEMLPHLIVVHTTEQDADLDGHDHGAEAIADYARTTTRDVSWHASIDSDSTIPMLPPETVAWHVRNYNTCGWGAEQACKATTWERLPDWWRAGTIAQLARTAVDEILAAHPVRDRWRLDRQLTRAEADAGAFGFVGHARLDPDRRSDPGAGYEWDRLLRSVRHLLEGTVMRLCVYAEGVDHQFASAAVGATRVDGYVTGSLHAARAALDEGKLVVALGGPGAMSLFPDLADWNGDGRAEVGERRDGSRVVLIGAGRGETYKLAGDRLPVLAAS